MNSKLIKITAFIFLVIPMICQAEIIQIGFTGKVDSIFDNYNLLEGKVHQNQAINGFYVFDSTKSDSNPSIYTGTYQYITAPNGMFLSAGDISFQTDPANVNLLIGLSNNYWGEPWDVYSVSSRNNLPLANGLTVDFMFWQLDETPGTVLSSDALPLTPPDLSKWQNNMLSVQGGRYPFPSPTEKTLFTINGHVETVYLIPVPEPTTLFLLGLGCLLIRKRK